MDVAVRATDMPLPRRLISLFLFSCAFSFFAQTAHSIEESKPLHYSADRQLWNRRDNKVELYGNVVVRQPGETLTSDYATLDLNARIIDAKGNCIYITSDTVIRGEEMHFNLDSRTGSIIGGRVSNDRFSLSGERINKLGSSRFQTHWGEYSTCHDCPNSWAFHAEDVDMEFEGYAHLSNVTAKIKDAPLVWFPYLIVPIKSKRQTGFLFPTFGATELNGTIFVLPFFWAIDRSVDMTFAVGEYTAQGHRLEWEGRYALSPRGAGKANLYYLTDRKPTAPVPRRWAVDIAQAEELPFGIEEKFRFIEVSDNLYPTYVGDVPGRDDIVLSSDLVFSKATPDLSAYVAAKRFRNLLNTNPVEFDGRAVQIFPTSVITTNDRIMFGSPVVTGLTLGVTNFNRAAGPFDYDNSSVPFGSAPSGVAPAFRPGIDPIREATRFSITPSIYTTLRPFDVLSVVPSLRYNSYFYSFPSEAGSSMNSLYRGYLLFQTDLSTQLERIYDTSDPAIPRMKHLIRPLLTYSYIPKASIRPSEDLPKSDKHPFLRQIDHALDSGFSGYNFDNYDIVPFDSSLSNINYFAPLGNSLSYGFATQLVRRRGTVTDDSPSYQRSVEFSAGQSLNFLEYQKGKTIPQPFSRFFSVLNLSFDKIESASTYYYYPYISKPRHVLSTSAGYVFERATRQRVLLFDRSVSMGYAYNKVVEGCTDPDFRECGTVNLSGRLNFSLSDYILPSLVASYDFVTHRILDSSLNIQFQSPSQCWKFAVNITRSVDRKLGSSWDLALNLTGSGFGGITEVATKAMSR